MRICFILVCFFTSLPAYAAEDTVLSLCNHNTDRAIYAAHMRQLGGGAGWASTGWFKVAAKECTDVKLGQYTGSVFLYAQDEFSESTWGEGQVKFCVHRTNGFSINNADVAPCTDATLMKVNSDEISVHPGKNTWDIQKNFADLNFCNHNPDFSVFTAMSRPNNGTVRSKGWYEVPAGQCRLITVGKYTGDVGYYAKGKQFTWEGDASRFCVNSTLGFDLTNADQPSSCTGTGLEMVNPRSTPVAVGTTTVNFEPLSLNTTLFLCNKTDKPLLSSRALPTSNGLWQSTGWLSLPPQNCATVDLGTYVGKVQLYAEWNQGEQYWGKGPFNFCVHRAQNFTLPDSANTQVCNSSIANKMVPSFEFTVRPGTNTFTFNP